jgi:hypothetical protein
MSFWGQRTNLHGMSATHMAFRHCYIPNTLSHRKVPFQQMSPPPTGKSLKKALYTLYLALKISINFTMFFRIRWCNNNNLLTESEGSTGKYPTEVLLYWPSDAVARSIQQDRGWIFTVPYCYLLYRGWIFTVPYGWVQ